MVHMGASINRGPQNRPKYIMVLIIGTTKTAIYLIGKTIVGYSISYGRNGLM